MKSKHTIRCGYCGRPAILKPASEIYHDPGRKGYVYTCSHYPACDAYVGTYPGTKIPMGTLANRVLRKKRIQAHIAFDTLWKNGIFSRNDAYRWLGDKLGIQTKDAHIAKFSEFFCEQVIIESQKVLKNHLRQHAA